MPSSWAEGFSLPGEEFAGDEFIVCYQLIAKKKEKKTLSICLFGNRLGLLGKML